MTSSYEAYQQWKNVPLEERPTLSVVIPAYNEAERIVPTIGAISSHVCSLGMPWELIIADDGSTDETVAEVAALAFANLRLLVAERNGGKGRAVKRGILAAKGDYILFADADNSTPIEELAKLLDKCRNEGFDAAIGSRALSESDVQNKSALRQLLSNGLNWIVRTFFRITVRDTQCGFKLFTNEAAHRLHTAQTIDGFSFDLEILYLAEKLGYRVAEVPVAWFDAPGSKVDGLAEVRRFLRDLVKIRLADMRGVYAHA